MPATFDTDTPRGVIAQRISDEHKTWRVVDYPDGPENLGRGAVYVAVYRTTVSKPAGSPQALEHAVTVDLYGAPQLAPRTEGVLDDLLDDLLLTVAAMRDVTWTTAERHAFDTMQGWRITLTLASSNIYAAGARRRPTA